MSSKTVALVAWTALLLAMAVPIAIAANSPFLASRGIPYIAAGLAGALALALLLIQPLLAAGYLPSLHPMRARSWHRTIGIVLVAAVAVHVGGLYLTSPADALDALLLVSPTPFSVYGVLGMWALALAAALILLRRRLGLSPTHSRIAHNALAAVAVVGTVVHALLIDGTMGTVSKTLLCVAVIVATGAVILHLRVVKPMRRRR